MYARDTLACLSGSHVVFIHFWSLVLVLHSSLSWRSLSAKLKSPSVEVLARFRKLFRRLSFLSLLMPFFELLIHCAHACSWWKSQIYTRQPGTVIKLSCKISVIGEYMLHKGRLAWPEPWSKVIILLLLLLLLLLIIIIIIIMLIVIIIILVIYYYHYCCNNKIDFPGI